MRRLTVLTAVLLSSSMLSATAAAQTQSQSALCKPLEQRVDQCQRTGPNTDSRESCDRTEAAFVALCGPLGPIGTSASAAGGAMDLLRRDFQVVPIEQTAASVFPSHLVIGPADLNDPKVIALLKRSYGFGKTVAIVGATKDAAGRFHGLLRPGEKANCQPATGHATIPLYGLQRSRYRVPPQHSSYCLVNLDPQARAEDRRWLRLRFGPTPPQPAAGTVTTTDNSTQFLTDLATATHCSIKSSTTTPNGPTITGAIGADLYVYTMRDFTDTGCGSCKDQGADYYLVQDNLIYTTSVSSVNEFFVFAPGLGEAPPNEFFPITSSFVSLEFTDPPTTTSYESEYSNSLSFTAQGSVGLSAAGPNVTVGGSVTTNNSTTYSVPPTTILNQSNILTSVPQWTFKPQNLPLNTDFQVNPTWTWFIPRDAYPKGGTGSDGIDFQNDPGLAGNGVLQGQIEQICFVPVPFSAWTVNPPLLTSLAPASTASNGGVFTITGQYLYPGSVVSVLIGGIAVPLSTNVDLVDDTTIEVTVPGGLGLAAGTYPVQVNTQFNNENRFSNTLSLTLTN
jgi:hypothetical protein